MSFMAHEQAVLKEGGSMSILETDFFKYQIGSKEYDHDSLIQFLLPLNFIFVLYTIH